MDQAPDLAVTSHLSVQVDDSGTSEDEEEEEEEGDEEEDDNDDEAMEEEDDDDDEELEETAVDQNFRLELMKVLQKQNALVGVESQAEHKLDLLKSVPLAAEEKSLWSFLNMVYLFQATEEDASSDEDLDDEAMMELDKSLAAVFSEQQKRSQAKKDEKTKIRKEKTLVRDFKIKVVLFVSAHVWFWLEADSQALLTWVLR